MRDLLLTALKDVSRPYLLDSLARTPVARHAAVIAQVEAYRQFLADVCLQGYGGAGMLTTDFIRTLHQSLFPKGFKQEVKSFDGDRHWMVPGQYKASPNGRASVQQSQHVIAFLPPEHVPAAMEKIVASLNAALQAATEETQRTDVIFGFLIDFLAIHPFQDANGRVACILADLLAIREGMQPLQLHRFKGENQSALHHAIEVAQQSKNLKLARKAFDQYRGE